MKTALPALALVLTTACIDFQFDGPLLPPDAFEPLACGIAQSTGGECVTADDPLAFSTNVRAMVVQGEVELDIVTHSSLDGFILQSDNTDVVDIIGNPAAGDDISLIAGEPGLVTVSAMTLDGTLVLDDLTIEVAEPTALALEWDATLDRQADGGLGLLGGSERVQIVFRDDTDQRLHGIRSDLTVAFTGALRETSIETTEDRISQRFWNGWSDQPNLHALGVEFAELGSGTVSVQSPEGLSTSIQLQVVERAANLTIELDTQEPRISEEFPIALLIARDSDDRPIAGVRGLWTVEPADRVQVEGDDQPASEIMLVADEPLDARVSCNVGGEVIEAVLPLGQ